MIFDHEVGAIISENDELISVFDGNIGDVDFPDEMIQKLHKLNPGYIGRFTHTHPPGIDKPSSADHEMMRNFAYTMYPFPVRLGIITPKKVGNFKKNPIFVENIFQWVLESSENWKARRMVQDDTKRGIVYERVASQFIFYQKNILSWQDWIIQRSYNVNI